MTQPIFLSYASQDADAARRICEALRAAGLEVWFDQNELTGGDAWDQKIRRQIKECALFVPMISATTNAREEGYFRREWNLAVDRMMDMSDNKSFLFPVLLDDLPEAGAIVPEKFRERQWTRINDEQSAAKFAARLAQALNGSAKPSGPTITSSAEPNSTIGASRADAPRRRTLIAVAIGLVSLGGVAFWSQRDRFLKQPGSVQSRDPQLQRAAELIDRHDAIISDVNLAEDLVKSVLDARPADIDATVLMARVQTYYLSRGFDTSSARSAKAKQFAERALTMAPNDPDAMASLGSYLDVREVDIPRAGKLLRQAMAVRPDEPRYYRALANNLRNTPESSPAEVIALLNDAVQKFPRDALVHYDLAREYRNASMVREMELHLDRAIELGKLDSAYVLRARYRLYLHGDIQGMKADLNQLSDRGRSTDRALLSKFTLSLMSSEPETGIQALSSKPEPWIADYEFTGPTQLLLGELLLLQGKVEFAKQQFEFAMAEIAKRQSDIARDLSLMALEAWLTMRLGRLKEAKNRTRLLLQEIKRPYRIYLFGAVSFTPIPLCLLIGERQDALSLLRDAVDIPIARSILRSLLSLDPRLAKSRGDKEIAAILGNSETSRSPK